MRFCPKCKSTGPFLISREYYSGWVKVTKCPHCGYVKYDEDEQQKKMTRPVCFEPGLVGDQLKKLPCQVVGCSSVYSLTKNSIYHKKYPFCARHRKRMFSCNGTNPPIKKIDGKWIEVIPPRAKKKISE